jgi:hypothetical protein
MDARIKSGHDKMCQADPTGKSPLPIYRIHVKSRNQKYFPFRPSQITGTFSAVPFRQEGRSRSSRTWNGDAMDAEVAA